MAELNDPVIGGRLDSSVIKQLEKRVNILSKTSREIEELQYLNSNTGWVKLTSSVNTEITNLQGKKEYSNILAKNNIMFSGTSSDTGGIKGGVFGNDPSYSMSSTLGIRPMAGIIDVKITSQNTFGTLKVATVNLTVNSIEQLDTLEALFMRPGFTALLEWGHTVYPDNDSNSIITTPDTIDSFFTPSNRTEIQKLIKAKKKDSSNNYDAMYGVIKNFVWNMNLSGGYDCQVDLISVGEILESIQVNVSHSTILSSDPFKASTDTTTQSDKFSSKYKTTALHAYLNLIKFSGTQKYYTGKTKYNNQELVDNTLADNLRKYMNDFFIKVGGEVKKAGNAISYPTIKVSGAAVEEYGAFTKYISFAQLLSVINEAFLLKDNDGLLFKFFIGEKDKVTTPFLTFQGHLALDPMIAVLPKPRSGGEYTISNGNIIAKNKNWEDLLRYNITEAAYKIPTHGQYNDILGIYLNIDYVLNCLDTTITTEDITNRSLRDFLNKILNGLQETLGGINDFDLHFDDDNSTYYIVDRKVTPDSEKLKGSNIQLIGLNSIVENLTLVSKLTSSISTMMAVSAQATSSDIGQDILSLQKWQQGLKDRHSEDKQLSPREKQVQTEAEVKKNKEKIKAKYLDWLELKKIVDKLNTPANRDNLDYSKGEIQGASASFRALMVKLLEFNTKKRKTSPAGLIPLELNLTIQGLGGLKIGQAFTISEELLPSRYKGNVAFLITGLDHSITGNKWTTGIKAQMIIIGKYDQDVEIDIEEINRAYQYFQTPPDLTRLIGWKKPLTTLTLRNDAGGLGAWGTSRLTADGSIRIHEGTDYIAPAGTPVFSPIDGVIQSTGEFTKPGTVSIRVQGTGEYSGYGVWLGYAELTKPLKSGSTVKAGQAIGYMQDMTKYYKDSKMINHLHFAVYVGTDKNSRIDATELKFT